MNRTYPFNHYQAEAEEKRKQEKAVEPEGTVESKATVDAGKWSTEKARRVLTQFVDSSVHNDRNRQSWLRAIEILEKLPSQQTAAEEKASEPDVYRAAWMNKAEDRTQ